jgi:ADP-ribose pyrophosphatase
MQQRNPLTRISSRHVHEGHLVSIREDQVSTHEGQQHPFTAITFKVCGVCVLPIDAEGNTRLVGQHRYVADRYTWELVRGAGDPSDPLSAAKRELKEETGLTSANWLQLLDLMASPGLTDERAPAFVAWGTQEGHKEPDDTEKLRIRRLPFKEAADLVLMGEIQDAPSCALILATYIRAQRGDLPNELVDLLA